MTTKIQPTNLDSALDYSVNKLSISGVDVLGYAQSAFLQANTVYNVANTLSPTDTFARTQANSSFVQANSSYTQANTATTNAATADSKAVSAGLYANAAFAKANTGGASGLIYKASATTPATANIGDQWYSTTEDILYEYLSDGTSNAWVDITSSAITTNSVEVPDSWARTQANASYTQANTAVSNAAGASDYANSAFIKANAAFTQANTGGTGGTNNARSIINSYVFGN